LLQNYLKSVNISNTKREQLLPFEVVGWFVYLFCFVLVLYQYGLSNCKEKLPLTKFKFQERKQIPYELINSFCWKEESKVDFVRLHFLLPLQPTGYLHKHFKVQLKEQKKSYASP